MSWFELRVVVPRTRVDGLADVAFAHGASGVEEANAPGEPVRYKQPWETEPAPVPMHCTFRAWFPADRVEQASVALTAASGLPVEQLPVEDEDWSESWKHHHHRVVVSERLRIAPPWEAVPGDLIVPPGNAFGTGDHPTTLACLGAIDRLARECRTCLDIGCGSGVLALAAAQLGLRAEGVDIDPEAVETARENAKLNELRVEFSTTDVQNLREPADLVVANLFAEVLVELAPELVRLTGRHLVLAGVLRDRAEKVIERLSPPLALSAAVEDGDWVSLHFQRI